MANDANFVKEMLVTLENRVASIANSIIQCNNLGLIPSKSSLIRLQWYNILICAYKNYRIFDDTRKNRINLLFRKVSEL